MHVTEFPDKLIAWSLDNPYYYTDGRRFYANPSNRTARRLTYVGRFPNAKQARAYFLEITGDNRKG